MQPRADSTDSDELNEKSLFDVRKLVNIETSRKNQIRKLQKMQAEEEVR